MSRYPPAALLAPAVSLIGSPVAPSRAEPFVVVKDGEPRCDIVVDTRGSTLTAVMREKYGPLAKDNWFKAAHHRSPYAGYAPSRLDASGFWLAEWIDQSTQADVPVRVDTEPQRASIILSLAQNYLAVAAKAGLSGDFLKNGPIEHLDSFCIVSTADRLYLLGRTELGCRHAIASLLRYLGYRFFNPAPRWCIAPRTGTLAVDLTVSKKPALLDVFFNNTEGHGVNVNQADNALWLREMYWGT